MPNTLQQSVRRMQWRLGIRRRLTVGLTGLTATSVALALAQLAAIALAGRSLGFAALWAPVAVGIVAALADRLRSGSIGIEEAASELDRRLDADDLFLSAATAKPNGNVFVPALQETAERRLGASRLPRRPGLPLPDAVRLAPAAFVLLALFLAGGRWLASDSVEHDGRRQTLEQLVMRLHHAVGGGGAALASEAEALRLLAEAIRDGRIRLEAAVEQLDELGGALASISALEEDPALQEAIRQLIDSARADIDAIREAIEGRGIDIDGLAARPLLSEEALEQKAREALKQASLASLSGEAAEPIDPGEIERYATGPRNPDEFAQVAIRFEESLEQTRRSAPLPPRHEAIVRRYLNALLASDGEEVP